MTRLEDIISRDYTVVGHGRYLKTLEHDSLVIDVEKQVFYWNSKGISGNALDWLTKIKGVAFSDAKRRLGTYTPELYWIQDEAIPDENIIVNDALVDVFFDMGKEHRDYWRESRGYKDTTIDQFKLGYTGEWYTIPFFIDGKFRNFQCRKPPNGNRTKVLKSWYKGVGPLPFNLDYVRYQDFALLTEGPVDAIMAMQNRLPAMSQNVGAGNFNPEWAGRLHLVSRIYIVYDNDDAGRKGAKTVASFFGDKARIYCFDDFPEKYDVTDFFKNGGTRQELLEILFTKSKRKEEVSNG